MKKSKVHKESHVAPTKYGMGDSYGQGIKNPIGIMRDNYEDLPKAKAKIGKPPKSLA